MHSLPGEEAQVDFFQGPATLDGRSGQWRRPWVFRIGGGIVQYVWNWLLPPLVGWREITFWQALGMLALCRILFGGSGWRGSVRSNVRRRMEERCVRMTPEERERFRQRMRERFGFGPATGESQGQ
jgi:hypothetical protein